ncbi:MAG: GAF domain-containing protein [Nitrospirae bacterium]|nr:GAF domain-containing protein [Nitrospirota bacterium]
MDKKRGILKKADEFLQIFKQGEEFTRNLLSENERLRFRIAELEEARTQDLNAAKIRHYEEHIRMLKDELESLKERFKRVETENRNFEQKYLLVAEENNNLANLYVASYQLHSTLDYEEVIKIVVEIIINLIGAERFAVMLMDERLEKLVPIASEGISTAAIAGVFPEDGIIGTVLKEGESYFSEEPLQEGSDDPASPSVCIPLKIKEHVIGVIAIYSFLVQKRSFSNVDYELFNLLAGHAATAIFSSRLYTRSEREFRTIQNFLELLKGKSKQ